MKKALIILVAALFGAMPVKAYHFELGGIYYNFIEGTEDKVEVTYPIEYRHDDYDGEGDYYGDIVIPGIIVYENKQYLVTSIGEQAFRESGVKTVTIPKSIEYIGFLAFRDCSALEKIEVRWRKPLDLRQVESKYPKLPMPYYSYSAEDIFDFSEQDFARVTLVVPQNTKTLYQEQDVWKHFVNVEEKEEFLGPEKIAILDGTVVLTLDKGTDFPCIGLRLSDRNMNTGLGTYMEIKKSGEFYLMKYKYELTQYSSIDKAVGDYLEDLFTRFYEDRDENYGKKVWTAFIEEGGLQLFLDIIDKFIDDEFLHSPFNEIYG